MINLWHTLLWIYLNTYSRIKKVIVTAKMITRNQISFYPNIVLEFEKKYSKFIGTKHAITFANGTTAIEAAIYALDLNAGDEVIVPSYTIPSSFAPILNSSGMIRFADIDIETLNIDYNDIKNKISNKTKGIIVVHLWGNPVDMDNIMRVAKENELWVIEDCSHAHGAMYDSKMIGAIGDIGIFSLQGSKAIAAGEGGIAVTNSSMYIEKMLFYAHQGRNTTGTFSRSNKNNYNDLFGGGRKSRAHPLGSGIATVDLDNIYLKNKINQFYWEFVSSIIKESGSFLNCVGRS